MWVAILGTPFLSTMDGRAEKVLRIQKHPFYNVYTLDYDVALLELAVPLHYTSAVKPICLPDSSHRFRPGAQCFITGWGSTKEGGIGARLVGAGLGSLLPDSSHRGRGYRAAVQAPALRAEGLSSGP